MKNVTRAFALTLMVALVAGCKAHVPMADAALDTAAKEFKPQANTANLYVYRNENLGFALTQTVFLDGAWLGDTAAKTYLHVPLEAGSHQLVSKAENTSEVAFTAEPGKNYFVWQEVKMGVMTARTKLHVVDEQ